jgi:hypothetical protein
MPYCYFLQSGVGNQNTGLVQDVGGHDSVQVSAHSLTCTSSPPQLTMRMRTMGFADGLVPLLPSENGQWHTASVVGKIHQLCH